MIIDWTSGTYAQLPRYAGLGQVTTWSVTLVEVALVNGPGRFCAMESQLPGFQQMEAQVPGFQRMETQIPGFQQMEAQT